MTETYSLRDAQDTGHAWQTRDRVNHDPKFARPQLQQAAHRPHEGGSGISMDVTERECCFYVSAAVPGVHPEDIKIALRDNVLTIKGVFLVELSPDQESHHLRERMRGAFSRSVVFAETINAAQVKAVCEDGVVDVLLPKRGCVRATKADCIIAGRQNGNFVWLDVITQPV